MFNAHVFASFDFRGLSSWILGMIRLLGLVSVVVASANGDLYSQDQSSPDPTYYSPEAKLFSASFAIGTDFRSRTGEYSTDLYHPS